MTAPHPAMDALGRRMAELGMSRAQMAIPLRTSRQQVARWLAGAGTPSCVVAARWAEVLELRLAVIGDDRVWAEGRAIPSALCAIRRRRGLTQTALADLCGVGNDEISRREAPHRAAKLRLSTVDGHVRALGLRIVVLRAERHTGPPRTE